MPSKRGRGRTTAPDPPRRAKTEASPTRSSQAAKPHFCFFYADRASRNRWAFKPNAEDAPSLLDFICDMAQLTWGEIENQTWGNRNNRHRKHHDQPVETLEEPAQADIALRKLDTTFGGDIFRFRLAGEARLWGFRRDHVFHVVWWDPNHKVYDPKGS